MTRSDFTPEERGLLDAILADPDDDDRRLVYADWLEERGDPRAEYVRQELVETAEEVLPKLPTVAELQARAEYDVIYVFDDPTGGEFPAELAHHVEPAFGRAWVSMLSRSVVRGCDPSPNCPQRWSRLRHHVDPTVRSCSVCKRSVFCCFSALEGYCHALLGEMIVVPFGMGSALAAGSGFATDDDPEAFVRLQRALGKGWSKRVGQAMSGRDILEDTRLDPWIEDSDS